MAGLLRDAVNLLKFEGQNWWSALTWSENSIPDLCGRTIIVTGATVSRGQRVAWCGGCVKRPPLLLARHSRAARLYAHPLCTLTTHAPRAQDGVGWHCARAFAEHGARVVIHGRNQAKAEA